ncbi:bifunctional hydroxymethylpyrimidine kinase/phosphomethylpyrimidine kinase [Telluribacter sp. SYSU D00476]|uniref:bifunctional hydroxymethylpyrimidine kinase/phosphomethylpyrimidine kinase n=1 Tax=Telluribacter sp. SYSU D00476 TaxID=2811430 RepID=UPI001FF68393|nr:bifunctional hydroxymethylpyrimidine kinase/phosphomethylpyrimidine kinase [Telluribacter sp. SYSU D00476]
MKSYHYHTVLSIAGSDSGGGAGIQADLKTVSALGCFGTTAITAITVQNTLGVQDVHCIPAAIVSGQIRAVMDDLQPAAVKIGMVPDQEVAEAVVEALRGYAVPVVFDPVLISSSGRRLVTDETIKVFRSKLLPLCTLITPNISEAVALAGTSINGLDDMKVAAHRLVGMGCKAVLITGGHLAGPHLHDVFVDHQGLEQVLTSHFIQSTNLHGTGCTLSSAVAALLARGLSLMEAIWEGIQYVQAAIEQGKDVQIGAGTGPLNHFYNPQQLIKS